MVEEESNNYGETYNFLLNVSKGYDPYYNYPSDLISRVEFNKTNPRFSKVYIKFDSDEMFLKTLGLDDYDIAEYREAFHPYYDYYETDYSYWKDEWLDGYIIHYFNSENLNLLSEIIKLINPTLSLSERDIVSRFLYETYGEIVEDIFLNFGSEKDDCIRQSVKDIMISETEDPYKKIGIEEENYGYLYSTTVANLLLWYRMSNKENEDVDQVLKYWVEKLGTDKDIGEWGDLRYMVNCETQNFNLDSINNEIKWSLERILEDVESKMEDENFDLKDYLELYNKVNKMGGFKNWIPIPGKKIDVWFDELNKHKPFLVFYVNKSESSNHNTTQEKRSVNNLEELNLTLYQPELFEKYTIIINKLKHFI